MTNLNTNQTTKSNNTGKKLPRKISVYIRGTDDTLKRTLAGGAAVDLDIYIAFAVTELNRLGYRTRWSGQGNHKDRTGKAFILFAPGVEPPKELMAIMERGGFAINRSVVADHGDGVTSSELSVSISSTSDALKTFKGRINELALINARFISSLDGCMRRLGGWYVPKWRDEEDKAERMGMM